MRVLLDTCIIIDALQNREPFSKDAQTIFLQVANSYCIGYITANSVSDIYYIMHKSNHSNKESRAVLEKLFKLFGILDTTSMDCIYALPSPVKDYEDALATETAYRYGIDCIVTRNITDFKNATIPIYTPKVFIEKLYEEI